METDAKDKTSESTAAQEVKTTEEFTLSFCLQSASLFSTQCGSSVCRRSAPPQKSSRSLGRRRQQAAKLLLKHSLENQVK